MKKQKLSENLDEIKVKDSKESIKNDDALEQEIVSLINENEEVKADIQENKEVTKEVISDVKEVIEESVDVTELKVAQPIQSTDEVKALTPKQIEANNKKIKASIDKEKKLIDKMNKERHAFLVHYAQERKKIQEELPTIIKKEVSGFDFTEENLLSLEKELISIVNHTENAKNKLIQKAALEVKKIDKQMKTFKIIPAIGNQKNPNGKFAESFKKIKLIELKTKMDMFEADIQMFEKTKEAKIQVLRQEQIDADAFDKYHDEITQRHEATNEITREKLGETATQYNELIEETQKVDSKDTTSLRQIKRYNKKPKPGSPIATMSNPDNIVEIRNLRKFYTTAKMSQEVLKELNLAIEKGEIVVLYGKSGSGKSTLLNIVSGLDRATYGDVVINGTNVTKLSDSKITKFRRVNMGFIFQRYNLLPNLNAYENVETGAFLQPDRKKRLNIKDTFELMDISDCLYKYPSEMSGGQQQRVSIARALVKNPTILFADEPTGALDDKMSLAVLKILKDINQKFNTTIIMVSHNPLIAEMAHKVVTLKSGLISDIVINKNPKNPEDLNW